MLGESSDDAASVTYSVFPEIMIKLFDKKLNVTSDSEQPYNEDLDSVNYDFL